MNERKRERGKKSVIQGRRETGRSEERRESQGRGGGGGGGEEKSVQETGVRSGEK